jgi:hypothetical protein
MAQGKISYQVKLAQRKGTPDAPDVRKGSMLSKKGVEEPSEQ